jgi:hypothetical protein
MAEYLEWWVFEFLISNTWSPFTDVFKHFEPRGFYVWTDDIEDESSWSEPVYFDQLGIDQDVSEWRS